MKKAVFVVILALLLLSTQTLMFRFQQARAEPRTWIVDDDGPADFHAIQEAINAASDGDTVYVHNGTYNECLTVNRTINLLGENSERTTIVSTPSSLYQFRTINITADNVNVSRFTIRAYGWGPTPGDNPNTPILVFGSNSRISESKLTYGFVAVDLRGSHSTVTNNVMDCMRSMGVSSSYNNISYNMMWGSWYAVYVGNCSSCWIIGNNIAAKDYAFMLYGHTNVTIANNDVSLYGDSPWRAIAHISNSTGARFYHTNFLTEGPLASPIFFEYEGCYPNSWDDGYPSGGNYWNHYKGGQYQKETGSDGICDTAYILDPEGYYWCNIDRNPLMQPYLDEHDIAVTSISKVHYQFEFVPIVPLNTVLGIGLSVHFNVFVTNYGNYPESFNVTVYANSTVIGSPTGIYLASRASVILNFTWETIPGPVRSSYTLSAQATSVPGEADTTDNTPQLAFMLLLLLMSQAMERLT